VDGEAGVFMESSQLEMNLADALTGELRSLDERLLDDHPVEAYIGYLDAYPKISCFSFISAQVSKCCDILVKRVGERGLAVYHKLVLLTLSRRSTLALPGMNLSEDVRAIYLADLERIVNDIACGAASAGRYQYPQLCKDLAVCSLRLIPAGVAKLHLHSLPRQFLLTSNLGQSVRAWRLVLFDLMGKSPLYEYHMDSNDPACLPQFNPLGWTQFYIRAAALLRLNPRVKGLFGITWFYDPVLDHVSPRLAYLRTLITDNGGKLFRFGPCNPNSIKDATFRSPTRRALYEQGKYTPTLYLAVWPRRELLAWAQRQ
jgi:hypothetical protein